MKTTILGLCILVFSSCGILSKKSSSVQGFGGAWEIAKQESLSIVKPKKSLDSVQVMDSTFHAVPIHAGHKVYHHTVQNIPKVNHKQLRKGLENQVTKTGKFTEPLEDDPEEEKYSSLIMLGGAILCALLFFLFLIGEASLLYILVFGALAVGLWTASLVVAIKRIYRLRTQGKGLVKYDFLALLLHGVAAFLIWLSFQ